MKALLLMFALLPSFAYAGEYSYVYPKYQVRSNGPGSGSFRVDITMHNNGNSNATCTFEVGGQSQSVFVTAYGDANLNFPNVPSNPNDVRFACSTK